MTNYIIYISLPLLFYVVSYIVFQGNNNYEKRRISVIVLCSISLFLMLALRHYSVATDADGYYINWIRMSNVPLDELKTALISIDMEKGYLLSVWILSHIIPEPQFLFVFYGIFCSVSLGMFVYKNCINPVISFCFFNAFGLFAFFVQGFRQAIAICICLFAFEYVKKRKLFPFLLLVCIAFLFHASAIVFFIVYFVRNWKVDFKTIFFAIIAYVFSFFLLNYVIELINLVMNDSYKFGNTESIQGGFVLLILYFLILAAGYVFSKSLTDDSKLLFWFVALGLATYCLRYTGINIAQRVSHYYSFGLMAFIPIVMSKFNQRDQIILKIAFIILCYIVMIYKTSYSTLIPFDFFWQC